MASLNFCPKVPKWWLITPSNQQNYPAFFPRIPLVTGLNHSNGEANSNRNRTPKGILLLGSSWACCLSEERCVMCVMFDVRTQVHAKPHVHCPMQDFYNLFLFNMCSQEQTYSACMARWLELMNRLKISQTHVNKLYKIIAGTWNSVNTLPCVIAFKHTRTNTSLLQNYPSSTSRAGRFYCLK